MNTVIPQAWIIDERIRREQKKKKKGEDQLIPISLPERADNESGSFDTNKAPKQPMDHETVIIIDL